MLASQKLSKNVFDALLKRGYSREKIEQLSAREAFAEFCAWEGFAGWSDILANAWDSCKGAEVELPLCEPGSPMSRLREKLILDADKTIKKALIAQLNMLLSNTSSVQEMNEGLAEQLVAYGFDELNEDDQLFSIHSIEVTKSGHTVFSCKYKDAAMVFKIPSE